LKFRTNRGHAGVAATLVVAALVAPAAAVDDRLEAVGDYVPGRSAELQDIEIADGLLYLFGVGGLEIVDYSDPAAPFALGRYVPPGDPYERFYRGSVAGGYAYCGAREDLLQVIDVRDPAWPSLASVVGVPGGTWEGSCVHEGFLYAARHDDGLRVYDLAAPALPAFVSAHWGLVNAWDAAAHGAHVYVADGAGGLAVFDVADPRDARHLVSLPTSGSALDVDVSDRWVAVACGSAGVDVFSRDDPALPVLHDTHATAGLALSVEIERGLIFVAEWDGVAVIDPDAPYRPLRVGFEDTPVRTMGLAAWGHRVFAADWSRVRAYDYGPTLLGDLAVSVDGVAFGAVPVGASADTVFSLANTGGGPVNVSAVETFNPAFTVSPSALTLMPGDTLDVTLTFTPQASGFDGTFLRILSDDVDEGAVTLPLSADDDPDVLDLGESAPAFALTDLGGAVHTLSQYLGEVVVLAFFANW